MPRISILIFSLILNFCTSDTRLQQNTAMMISDEKEHPFPDVAPADLRDMVMDIPQRRAFLLWKDGEILMEEYHGNYQRNTTLNIKSASKSVLSLLAGAAIENGFLALSDSISKFLPDYEQSFSDTQKAAITVKDLLTMASGLNSTSFGNYGRWVVSRDWVGFALNEPLRGSPGQTMQYSTGDSHILAAVLTNAVGTDLMTFGNQYVFRPMRITIGGWDRDPQGIYFGGNNMAMSPAGLLKIGQLYLNGGNWNGRQIVTKNWIDDSLTPHFQNTSFNFRNHDYGYLWWRNDFAGVETWFAWGYGGQYLFIIPEINAVAIFTSNPDVPRLRGLNTSIYDVMEDGVIPFLMKQKRAEKG